MTRRVNWDRGIALPDHGLWLDPQVVCDTAFISHAHTDHARRHRQALLTADTLALIAEPRRPKGAQILVEGEREPLGDATVTVLGAGHMRGSAQLLFEHQGTRLLYTGDLKLWRQGGTATPVPKVDVLVIESTYGQPHFRFPDPDSALEQVALWCRRAHDSGATPVLLAQALGKAQELMIGLAGFGFRFALESRCLAPARAYQALGAELPDFVELDAELEPGRVVIAPPAGKDEVRRLGRYRTALVSGWACDPFWHVFGADTAFPYSDHCDFEELLEVVRRSGADQVYTVHGFTEDLARQLRKRGVRACALHVTEQLALAL